MGVRTENLKNKHLDKLTRTFYQVFQKRAAIIFTVKINQLIRKLLESNNMRVQTFFVIATTVLPVLHTLPSGSRWQHGKGNLEGPVNQTVSEGDSVKIFCHNKVVNDVLRFKWFINDILIDGENRDVLEITDFNKDYDKSQVKCVVSDRSGKEETVRVVELIHNKEKDRSPRVISRTFSNLDRNKPKHDVMMNDEDDSSFQEDDAIIKEFDETTKGEKTTFICVVEDDDKSISSSEPKYVWVNGKLTLNRNDAIDEDTKKQYKCRVVRNGVKKIQKLSKDLKTYSKSFKKMSKYLNNFSKY